MVRVTTVKDFISSPMSFVLDPLAFVDATVRVLQDAKTISLSVVDVQLAPIDAVFVLFKAKVFSFPEPFIVKLIADHFIMLNRITFIFKLTILFARRSHSLL